VPSMHSAALIAPALATRLGASGERVLLMTANHAGLRQTFIEGGRLRFSRLIEVIEAKLPEQERKQVLHSLGAKCADTYRASLIDRYKGNPKGFLEEGRRSWMAEADYDEAKGLIRIVDKSPHCSCPMVKEGSTPPSFCDCTLGWQEEAYSTILGRPVKAELEESILRGGKKCVYRIRVI